jgi:hypothetical protein
MLEHGFWAEVKVGGEHIRLFSEQSALGVQLLDQYVANFLSPEFEAHLLPYILFPGAVEIVLALWLLVRGVNVQRWKEQASAAVE